MTDAQKRAEVIAMYPKSKGWAKRVNKMSDGQVFAIWIKKREKEDRLIAEARLQLAEDGPPEDEIPF